MRTVLRPPLAEDEVRSLKCGDVVYLEGMIVTARDLASRRLAACAETGIEPPVDLRGAAVFHCGPLMRRSGDRWETVAAGPTTSARMNPTAPTLLEKLGVRAFIGKGGMGPEVLAALKRSGAVYLAMAGGCGVLGASQVVSVEGVYWLEFGMPEAMWVLSVREFGPLIVAMDSHGQSIYDDVARQVAKQLKRDRTDS